VTRKVAFVAPLPPPVHGFSNICAAMLRLLEARSTVGVFNRAPRGGARRAGLRALADPLRYLAWCARNRDADLYLGLSGGRGQLIDWPYLLIGKALRRRIFVHHHSYAYINAPSRLSRLLFALLRGETHIVLSEGMGADLKRVYGLDPSRVRVVSNAAFFDAAPERGPDRAPDLPIQLGYLSAISQEKGIEEFFAVLAELKRAGIPYRAYVAGPATPAAAEGLAQLLASAGDVAHCGPVYGKAKAAFLRSLDILLFPTRYANEAEPLVIHEAMRSGVHVIASRRGAIAEILSHGGGIACAESGFVDTALESIRRFAADPAALRLAQRATLERARRMGDAAAEHLRALLDDITGCAGERPETAKQFVRAVVLATLGLACALGAGPPAFGDVANNDTLQRALVAPDEAPNPNIDTLDLFVGGEAAYDNNIFRLPNGTDVATLIGPGASRGDHIDTASAGLDGQWALGRQLVMLDVDVDDNRFARNDNLNNVSSADGLKWLWALGDRLSGQLGTDFRRVLGNFYDTFNYARDMVNQTESWGSGRFALGPHVALFGGVMFTDTSLSQPALKVNDNERKAVDFGLEYALGLTSSLDFDYRYTDARYSHTSLLNGVAFDPDYRDDTARVTFKDALTEKTQIEALVGYLKRAYPSAAIGAFSGDIWRLSFDWHPTEKTELLIAGSRDLQADLSSQTDYYVSKAESVSPTWKPSEKITVSLTYSHEEQDFIGTNQFVATLANRRDLINAGQLNLLYSLLGSTTGRGLTFNFSVRREHRNSNQASLSYDDSIGKAGFVFKF
jgi:glycosyltransferase involved in cell wall biosynthesis